MAADLALFNSHIVQPGLDILYSLGGPSPTQKATRLLLAIALQEGGPRLSRYQVLASGNKGPARGVWQFERGGGVHGVMYHERSTLLARKLVKACEVQWDERAIHLALEHKDLLACGFARLLLWTDPRPLPLSYEQAEAWDAYRDSWRPGRPHPQAWPANWKQADKVVNEMPV